MKKGLGWFCKPNTVGTGYVMRKDSGLGPRTWASWCLFGRVEEVRPEVRPPGMLNSVPNGQALWWHSRGGTKVRRPSHGRESEGLQGTISEGW